MSILKVLPRPGKIISPSAQAWDQTELFY